MEHRMNPLDQAEDARPQKELSAFEKLRASIPDFPTDAKIDSWKKQTPGGRVQAFCPDGRRVWFMRGLTAVELSKIHANIPKNAQNEEFEIGAMAAATCTLWSTEGKFDCEGYRTGPAGLPQSLFAIVQNLSDFYDPSQLAIFSLEL
jgi:hypothetical protein